MRFAFQVLVAALSVAAPALADTDAPMATAGATPDGAAAAQPPPSTSDAPSLTVADQIDAFLRTSPARDVVTADGLSGVVRDRRIHGEVAVGVGTHGYRSLYARADMPLGERGFLSIAVEDSRGPAVYERGPVFGAYGLGVARDLRGCGLEALTPPRPIDALGGPNGRCPGPAYARPAN